MLLSHLGEYACKWANECNLAPIRNDRKKFVGVRKNSLCGRKPLESILQAVVLQNGA